MTIDAKESDVYCELTPAVPTDTCAVLNRLLQIADQGQGFDWRNYLELSPERATHNHGRGIAIACLQSFDHVEYIAPGNRVICRCNY